MYRISIIFLLVPDVHDYLFGLVTEVEIFETEEKINCLIGLVREKRKLYSYWIHEHPVRFGMAEQIAK
jgi:hypothetical protein